MNQVRIIFTLHCIILLCACTGTGGTLGNLIPMPKFLDGEVVGDYYYPKNKSFKVMLPHPPSLSKKDSYEWTYTKVHEADKGRWTKVIFGGAALDKNYYHIAHDYYSEKKITPTLIEMRDGAKKIFSKAIEAQPYRSVHNKVKLITFQDIKVNNRQGFYAAYMLGENGQKLVLGVVITNHGYFIIEADILVSSDNPEFNPTRETLINNNFTIFNRIIDSFEPLI